MKKRQTHTATYPCTPHSEVFTPWVHKAPQQGFPEHNPSPASTEFHFSLVICGVMELQQFIGITVGERSCGGYCVSPGPLEGGGATTLTEEYAAVFGKDLVGVEWSQLGIRTGRR